jgi:hypothetical protein
MEGRKKGLRVEAISLISQSSAGSLDADFPVALRLETAVDTCSMLIAEGDGIAQCSPIGGIVPDGLVRMDTALVIILVPFILGHSRLGQFLR